MAKPFLKLPMKCLENEKGGTVPAEKQTSSRRFVA